VHVFVQIARDVWRAHRWRDKLRIIFGHPGWRPPELGEIERPQEVSRETFEKFDPPVPPAPAWYAFAQFAVVLVASVVLLRISSSIPLAVAGVGAFFVAVALAGVGGIFESARWAETLESARQVTVAAACGWLLWTGLGPAALAWSGVLFSLASLAVLRRYRGALTK
jgi:hypothetical protein